MQQSEGKRGGLITDIVMQSEEYSGDIDVASASILAREAFLNALESLSLKYQIDLPKGAS